MDSEHSDKKLLISVAKKTQSREYGTVSGFNTMSGKKVLE